MTSYSTANYNNNNYDALTTTTINNNPLMQHRSTMRALQDKQQNYWELNRIFQVK